MSGTPTPSQPTPWPLAGTPEFERSDQRWRRALADRLAADLRRHVIDAWFPRSLDIEAGGFWAEHDVRWRRRGDGHRMLEFQARQTRTAARLGLAFPSQAERWRQVALHGFEMLAGAMADSEHGGWFWLVDRDGHPLYGGTKHSHGISYLLTACTDVHRLTGDGRASMMLERVVDWLEAVHHDDTHGGYHGWVTRDGRPILTRADVPIGVEPHEPLGHGIGLKDANVTSDILEGYTALAALQPSERVLARLRELYQAFVERLVTPDGGLHYLTYPDWSPVPTLERYGYLVQQVHRLPAAAAVMGLADGALELGRRVFEHALRRGWDDDRAAFISAGPGSEPDSIGGQSLKVREFEWWAQVDGLRALVLLAVNAPQTNPYRPLIGRLMATIERDFVDGRRGGWHARPVRDVPLGRRLRGDPAKGDDWKDASHEADAYLASLRMLKGLPDGAPLE